MTTIKIPLWVWKAVFGALLAIGAVRIEVWFADADKRREQRDIHDKAVDDSIRHYHWHLNRHDKEILFLQQIKQDKKTH